MSRLRRLAPLRHVIGPLLFAVIVIRLDRHALVAALAGVQLPAALAAGAAVLLAIPIRAVRWNRIVEAFGHALAPREALRLYAAGVFAGTATPGRVGEAYRAAPLTRGGMAPRRALATVLVDRIFDVGAVAAVGLCYAAAIAEGSAAVVAIAALVTLAALVAARFAAPAYATPGTLARVTALTALASVSAWVANHLLVRSLGLPLDPLQTAGISALAGLAAVIPVSMLGVGTRDAVLVLLLARYGISSTDAVALSTLFLFLNVWTGLACGVASLLLGMGAARKVNE